MGKLDQILCHCIPRAHAGRYFIVDVARADLIVGVDHALCGCKPQEFLKIANGADRGSAVFADNLDGRVAHLFTECVITQDCKEHSRQFLCIPNLDTGSHLAQKREGILEV